MATKRVLLLAYVFPPFGSVGGSVRAVKFAKYLPLYGWDVTVLTIADRPQYQLLERSSSSVLKEIPPSVRIVRTRTWQPPPRAARMDSETDEPNQSRFRALRRSKAAVLH